MTIHLNNRKVSWQVNPNSGEDKKKLNNIVTINKLLLHLCRKYYAKLLL